MQLCWKALAGVTVLALLNGCAYTSTQKGHLAGIESKLSAHDFDGALQQIQASKATGYKEKDKILYYLDAGMLNHYNSRWSDSNDLLTQAECGIEDAYTRSVRSAAASIMLNDNSLEYAGEDYEDVYLNIFKSINYLRLNSFDSAFVEVRRINDKLNLLEDKYSKVAESLNQSAEKGKSFQAGKTKFHNSALARYFSMLMYRADGKRDDARIDLVKIREAWRAAEEIYDFPMPSFSTVLTPSPELYAKLNIVSFYGRCPDKLARTLYVFTDPESVTIMTTEQVSAKDTKLTALEVIPWKIGNLLPAGNQLKFQMPYMKMRGTLVGRAVLYLNGYPVQDLAPVESLERVAFETFKIREPLIFLKTITRSIAKNIVKTKAVEELKKHKDGEIVPTFLLDMAVAATENADLRVAQFFPAIAAISEIDVPVGQHRVTVVYFDRAGNRLYQDEIGSVQVSAGRLNLVQSCYLN